MSESKDNNFRKSIDEFREYLKRHEKTYLINGKLPADKVFLQFEGKFEEKEVVWNACIQTIVEYSKKHPVSGDPKQFIDIKLIDGGYFLEVGLNIAKIDRTVLEATIIMIRKYKRLQFGRYEYGVRSKTG